MGALQGSLQQASKGRVSGYLDVHGRGHGDAQAVIGPWTENRNGALETIASS
jgi:hypothetical protein